MEADKAPCNLSLRSPAWAVGFTLTFRRGASPDIHWTGE